MEWNSKVPSWEFTEFQQNVEPSIINPMDTGSLRVLGNQISSMDCSVDLKLGGSGEFRPQNKPKNQYKMPNSIIVPSSSSSQSKRAKMGSSSSQYVSCSVDGCEADLSNCREYHRRHKVCEVHSKTPVVTVGGEEQRFCQQCSRFHSLGEFDEIKRSCRKRLDGHNRRRRKSHLESTNPDSMLRGHQEGSFFAYPQIFQSPILEPRSNRTRMIKFDDDRIYGHQQHLHFTNNQPQFTASLRQGYKKENQFSFVQESKVAFSISPTELPTCQPLKAPCSEERNSNNIFSGELTQVIDSDCALSLLSSSVRKSGINMSQMLPAERVPMDQPVASSMQYCSLNSYSPTSTSVLPTRFSCSTVEEQVAAVLVSDTDANLHCEGIFHVGGEQSSDEPSLSLPFSWQ